VADPTNDLPALPESGWPKGWWRANHSYACCVMRARSCRVKRGDPIYLTGKSGEMFCEQHAPEKRGE
jgi:hypothetical protein